MYFRNGMTSQGYTEKHCHEKQNNKTNGQNFPGFTYTSKMFSELQDNTNQSKGK